MMIDLHVHTPMGEGGGSLRSSDLIGYLERTNFVSHARAIGLDGVCLTEHDFVWPQEAIEAATKRFDFLFLRGMEVSTDYAPYGHVLAYGFDRYQAGIYQIERLREAIDRVDGILIVAHPFRMLLGPPDMKANDPLTLEKACERRVFQLVDGIEVYNGGTSEPENQFALDVCERLALKATGGSDAHSVWGIGTCVTAFEEQIKSQQDFLEALHSGRFRPSKNGH